MDDVIAAVGPLAATPMLVVACDFDGALAPLVDEPMAARALPSAVEALRVLAGLPRTHVALLSGRSRAALGELASASRIPGTVGLIGSHGWEDALDPGGESDATVGCGNGTRSAAGAMALHQTAVRVRRKLVSDPRDPWRSESNVAQRAAVVRVNVECRLREHAGVRDASDDGVGGEPG